MEILLSDELRLVYALLLQAAPVFAGWRFVRRYAGDRDSTAGRAADALLLALGVQYAAVCLPGVVGLLCPLSIAGVTLGLSGLLYVLSRRGPCLTEVSKPAGFALGCALFAAGYVVALAYMYRVTPVLANDAITYHFPAAVQWLQRGRISVFETWFFNPANAYSPLAGSAFITGLIAPMGNDVLARHVQLPALGLTFCAAVRIMRGLGVGSAVAGVCGAALVLSQPFLRQAIIEKDDLFLAAFATCAVAACTRERLRDPLGPGRLGVALGLLLATKYTALLALPALALLLDAPYRAGWRGRKYGMAVGLVLLIAGPWYLRNLLLTGNPVYPMRTLGMPGLFATTRSDEFTPAGAWGVLTGRDQSLPAVVMIPLLLLLIVAMVGGLRRVKGDPVLRATVFGPLISGIMFFALSPYPEARFLYPGFVLMFVAGGVGIVTLFERLGAAGPLSREREEGGVVRRVLLTRSSRLQVGVAVVVILVPSWGTGIKLRWGGEGWQQVWEIVGELTIAAALFTAAGFGLIRLFRRFSVRRTPGMQYGLVAAALGVAALLYTQWPGFIETCREAAPLLYERQYHATADAWQFVREKLPPDEPLAYANTYLIHPMSGFDHRRALVYVPTRRGVTRLSDLPPIPGGPLSGERLVGAVDAEIVGEPDAQGWLEKLRASGATYLIVFRSDAVPEPPELAMIRGRPERFERVFENAAATVYRLRF